MFHRVFVVWFGCLMSVFFVLNLAGFAQHEMGEGKRWTAGFPCQIAEWTRLGDYRKFNFYPWSILWNALICVLVSAALAYFCASARSAKQGDREITSRNDATVDALKRKGA